MRIIFLAIAILPLLAACDRDQATYMVGTLERNRIELRVESNEPITSINVQDGQYVTAGDLVLVQNPGGGTVGATGVAA